MEGLTEGRMVHYVMPDGTHAPAVVVKVWNKDNGLVNLSVFTDYSNALPYSPEVKVLFKDANIDLDAVKHGHLWATSKTYSEELKIGTWHWIEKA